MNQEYSFETILKILKTEIPETEYDWLVLKTNLLNQNFNTSVFYVSFSSCARFIHKKSIELVDFQNFNTTELARLCLLLTIPKQNFEAFKTVFYPIFDTADVAEQETLYMCFDYLPFKNELSTKFALGISTNIGSVFEKLALNNPYPTKYLSESAYNQLVIKTIFIEKNILEIVGLKSRLNPELSRMAKELISERKAAGRSLRNEIIFLI